MSHLLITGATGFIGSHLLPILADQNHQITATTRRELTSKDSDQIKFVQVGELNSSTDWSKALQNIDIVIHLAARAHILKDTAENIEAEFNRVNNEGTANLVKQAIDAGVKQFILISSIGAVTTLSETQITQNTPCNPDTPYGRSKRNAEQALINLANSTSMSWTIIRPTLVYGPGNPGNMERLIKLVQLGLPLPFGGVKNRRSFVYVENLVDAIATCLNNPNASRQIFLISDDEDVSTPELITYLADCLDKPCKLLPIPLTLLRGLGWLGESLESVTGKSLPFNQTTIERLLGSLFVDNSYIINTLNWSPPYTLKQGLEKTFKS